MKTHFRDFFANKQYFYISYSGRNLYSGMVFSIFDQLYGKRMFPILGKTSDNDYYHNEIVICLPRLSVKFKKNELVFVDVTV